MSRRRWLFAVAGLLVLLAALWGLKALMQARCWAWGAPLVCRVETPERIVALSFDDGPTRAGLDSVLPVLKANGARATFFVIGSEVEGYPEGVRRIAADGHEIGSHSFAHSRMISPFAAAYRDELLRTDRAIAAHGVAPPQLFRPPYGIKFTGLVNAVQGSGKRMVLWDIEEPAGVGAQAYARAIVDAARPGSIILIHPMYPSRSVERAALPLVLQGLRGRGFRVVPVSELLAREGARAAADQ